MNEQICQHLHPPFSLLLLFITSLGPQSGLGRGLSKGPQSTFIKSEGPAEAAQTPERWPGGGPALRAPSEARIDT